VVPKIKQSTTLRLSVRQCHGGQERDSILTPAPRRTDRLVARALRSSWCRHRHGTASGARARNMKDFSTFAGSGWRLFRTAADRPHSSGRWRRISVPASR